MRYQRFPLHTGSPCQPSTEALTSEQLNTLQRSKTDSTEGKARVWCREIVQDRARPLHFPFEHFPEGMYTLDARLTDKLF